MIMPCSDRHVPDTPGRCCRMEASLSRARACKRCGQGGRGWRQQARGGQCAPSCYSDQPWPGRFVPATEAQTRSFRHSPGEVKRPVSDGCLPEHPSFRMVPCSPANALQRPDHHPAAVLPATASIHFAVAAPPAVFRALATAVDTTRCPSSAPALRHVAQRLLHAPLDRAGEKRWPVSSVCCAIRARVSASVKSPIRSDFAATLNGLPPAMTSPALDRMR